MTTADRRRGSQPVATMTRAERLDQLEATLRGKSASEWPAIVAACARELSQHASGTHVPPDIALPPCPDWCADAGRHTRLDVAETDGPRLVIGHQGPTYGAFAVGTTVDVATGETVSVDVQLDTVVIDRMGIDGSRDPAPLRRLAADATAAADWLDAHRLDAACTCDPRHLEIGGYDRGCPAYLGTGAVRVSGTSRTPGR